MQRISMVIALGLLLVSSTAGSLGCTAADSGEPSAPPKQEPLVSPEEKPTYEDEAFAREAILPDGSPVQYGITLGTVDSRGGIQALDAWVMLPAKYNGNYDEAVVRAVADDIMATFEGSEIDTASMAIATESTTEDKPQAWGNLTFAFTEDGQFMSGPQAGHWEFTGPDGIIGG